MSRSLNEQQYEQLLKPLNVTRVAKRKGAGTLELSYLEAYDVKAHLIRIFGFGGWNWNVTDATLMYEEKVGANWSVGYKVLGTLHVPLLNCTYSEAVVGSAINPQRGECHDMAVKTAESDAIKRAAINLGTQFGLSLYNNGSVRDIVLQTLDVAEGEEK